MLFCLCKVYESSRKSILLTFFAYFPFLVSESLPLSPFSCSLPPFGQREPSSLTFPLHISSFWSERVLLSHLFLAHFLILVRESPPLSPFSCSLPHFGQRESSSLTFFLLTSSFWSERALLSHLFLAHFLILVRKSLPLSPFSCSLPHFGQRESSSLTFFLLTSSFWSERVLLSHFFLTYFLILVRKSPPLSPFSCSLPHFGQRESSSLTFFLLTSSFWSERALLSHFSLAYFLILI